MPYELCKKLKESGFPQPKLDVTTNTGGRNAYSPTLSELIEAFHSFAKLEHTGAGDIQWFAEAWNDAWDIKYHEVGETPEIAVATLWLSLNQK